MNTPASFDFDHLPVKVIQFGTGRFIRAFADAFIDEANRRGDFGGKIVMVASTGSGRAAQFNKQDGRFTLWTRGLVEDKPVEKVTTIRSIQAALSAQAHWAEVLKLACTPELAVICSNTTEIGLALGDNDRLDAPKSYPARLTALLYRRARHYDFDLQRGLVVLPCELIEHNGARLQSLIQQQSRLWSLGPDFQSWLANGVRFCNTLVDRIVPGLPDTQELETVHRSIGWQDPLLTVAEPYRLWAIEGDGALAERLGFAGHDGIVITPDITPYRIRKIRLLNGGHTLSVPLGLLAGCQTVLDNMHHAIVGPFIEDLMRKEIGPVLSVDPETVPPYISEVIARWSNPFMHHRLLDITLQSTTKMRHRVVPTLQEFYRHFGGRRTPRRIALGFAAWLLFMRGTRQDSGRVYGTMHGSEYVIDDTHAVRFLNWWPKDSAHVDTFVRSVLSCEDLWGCNLEEMAGFATSVSDALNLLLTEGPNAAVMGT